MENIFKIMFGNMMRYDMFGSVLLQIIGPYVVIGLLFVWAVAGLAILHSPKQGSCSENSTK